MISASSLPAFSASASAGSIRSQTSNAASAPASAATRDAANARGRVNEQARRLASLSDQPQSQPARSLPRGSLVNLQA